MCKLVCSLDTDVYHTGSTIVGGLQECDVIVQLSKYTDDRARWEREQDVNHVSTGCNYTSV